MITLYAFGPAFGLPDPSPFVTKAMMLLKLADLPFQTNTKGFLRAPKGKLPYIDDDGTIVADSTFIRWHIEKKYSIDFDRGLSAAERGIAWAFEKLAEDNLYWAIVRERWLDDHNFEKGIAQFFRAAPAPLRPLIKGVVRNKVRRDLKGQGIGRHAPPEIAALAIRGIDSIAAFLGEKRYFMGAQPTAADASVFPLVLGILCPRFDSPVRRAAEARPNLVTYANRMLREYFPDFADRALAPGAA